MKLRRFVQTASLALLFWLWAAFRHESPVHDWSRPAHGTPQPPTDAPRNRAMPTAAAISLSPSAGPRGTLAHE